MATDDLIETVFRREAARVLATLIRLLGDFDLAEEARQEAFAAALEQWPKSGAPANASAWLISVGRHKMIDRIRRDALFRSKIADLQIALVTQTICGPDDIDSDEVFGDDRLRLIFTCCHPALNPEAQIALTLREVCGLSTQAVARAFLTAEDTMAQRLVRAKRKIRDARIPYKTPDSDALQERTDGVLAVVYSVFTEGYAATSGPSLLDVPLSREAIRLGYLLDALLPNNAGVQGLLALMLLHDARRPARVSPSGDVVLLEHQDRSLWDSTQIETGLKLVDRALSAPWPVSGYAVQAAIAALHVRAHDAASTDWPQIVGLYEVLLRLEHSPVIELNHAVAVSMVDGAARALDLIDSLAAREGASEYHLLHAARARLLQQLGRFAEARNAYREALASAALEPERRFLTSRLATLPAESGEAG